MDYQKSYDLKHGDTEIWDIVSSKSYIKELLRVVSPVNLDLPDSFYEGKQHTDEITIAGRNIDYTAKMSKSDESREMSISIITDVLDATIRILVTTQSEVSRVSISVNGEAAGVATLFIPSMRGQLDSRADKAIQLLESRL